MLMEISIGIKVTNRCAKMAYRVLFAQTEAASTIPMACGIQNQQKQKFRSEV